MAPAHIGRGWQERFGKKGLTVIGMHTPETKRERSIDNVRAKVKENGMTYPIAVDNDRRNWKAWSNHVWPSVYLIDKKGRVRYWWYGELNWRGATGEAYLRGRIEELLAEAD